MSVKKQIPEFGGIYFIAFTCCQRLPLLEKLNDMKWAPDHKRRVLLCGRDTARKERG